MRFVWVCYSAAILVIANCGPSETDWTRYFYSTRPMQRSTWRWLCSRRPPSISNARSINRFLTMEKPTFRSLHQDVFPKHDLKDWNTIPASNNLPGYAILKKEIIKPEVDDREYRYIKLENNLEALLIHDANADKSAASMDVEVGHLHDPVSQFMFIDFMMDLSFAFIG